MMKYTKTHVHNPPKNIIGWASMDLNDLEIFFLNFPAYPQILKIVYPKQFFSKVQIVLKSHLRTSRLKIFWGRTPHSGASPPLRKVLWSPTFLK
jgi:hypothetical protein